MQKFRAKLAKVRQSLLASQQAEREAHEALHMYEQISRQSTAGEHAAQEQVQTLHAQLTASHKAERKHRESLCQQQGQLQAAEETLTATSKRLQLAEARAITAAEECEQSRQILQELISEQTEQVVAKTPSKTLPRQYTKPVEPTVRQSKHFIKRTPFYLNKKQHVFLGIFHVSTFGQTKRQNIQASCKPHMVTVDTARICICWATTAYA